MGAEQSREKHSRRDRDKDRDRTQTTPSKSTASQPHSGKPSPSPHVQQPVEAPAAPREAQSQSRAGEQQPEQQPEQRPEQRPAEPAASSAMAVAVPIEAAMPPIMSPSINATPDYFTAEQFTRPPRLPLPIEEEVHTPGSPVISPEEVGPLDIAEADGDLPRRVSVLSSTTLDDDDGEDPPNPQNTATVPTLIEWEGSGDRVYVTGTFVDWNRKFRLHRK
jgi:hypothetical protein